MLKEKLVYADFEFNDITNSPLNLVSCVTEDNSGLIRKWWLHKDKNKYKELADYLKTFELIIAYSAIAEARSFIALGLEPLKWQWVDLFLEYRMVTNHNDGLQWGNQLVDGKVKPTNKPRPKWQRTEEDTASGFRATHSLAEATYKLTGVIRDTEHKTKMRDLIISSPALFTPEEQEAILEYGVDDVKDLKNIWAAIKKELAELLPEKELKLYEKEAKWRGRYSAHTAIMEDGGYCLDYEKTKNFSSQVANIIHDCQRDINSLFPSIKPFKWNKAEQRFSWDQKATKDWIKKFHDDKDWLKTKGSDLSLSLDAFQRFFDYRHDYPRNNFGAQIVRYLKLKQSLNGFTKSADKEKRTFWSSVGRDHRVRPYLNIYGAQSSRTQPGSTGFMFLKPAWMRALVQPASGKFMAGIDYGSQEFFIAALLSEDAGMIQSYLSGDVYLAFGKLAGMIPKEGTKSTHKKERDLCKATVLGISFLMSKFGLALKLSADTGEEWTEDQAQEMIDIFYESYPELKDFQEDLISYYQQIGYIKLQDGWYMFGDNDNFRSVTNVPIQGMGAVIMRKAVDLAVAKGLYIPFTLHDAIYIEGNVGDEWQIKVLAECMRDAFAFYFEGKYHEIAKKITLDPFAWSPDYKADSEMVVDGYKFDVSNLYVDSRSIEDYNAFSKYFTFREEQLL